MKVEINENIGKTVKWITLSITNAKKEENVFAKFEGLNCLQLFEITFKENLKNIELAKHLNYNITNLGLSYLNNFKSLEVLNIRGGRISLSFPNMLDLKCLRTIYINDQSQSSEFIGIDSAPNLKNLYIGDFTFGKSISIIHFDNIVKIKNLTSLILSNIQIEFKELRKLKLSSSLIELTLNQKFEFEEFAELSVLLPNVQSNELRPWQYCKSNKGDVKVNGKRKPFLDSQLDSEKILRYENEFIELKGKYAI